MSSLDVSSTPISKLAASMLEADGASDDMAGMHHHCHDGHWFWGILFYWLIVALVLYFTLFALRPDFVLKKNDYGDCLDEIDQGKLLGSAIVISLIIIVVLAVLSWGFGYNHGSW